MDSIFLITTTRRSLRVFPLCAQQEGRDRGREGGGEILIKNRGDSGRELIVRAYCLLFVDAPNAGN